MLNLTPKRVTLFCGHYGTGKTNAAVNYAFYLKRALGKNVKIADMDIVNPYFRTKDSEKELGEAGIELISPHYANTNVDLPALPQELYGLFEFRDSYAVLDIGGDDRGAYALGRFAPLILEENDYDNFFVANFYRPLTANAADAFEVMKEIEAAGKVPFTGIVNNSNLGDETAAEDILKKIPLAEELAAMSGLPVVMTTAKRNIAETLGIENVLPLDLQAKYY
ncbi:MAG: hypothetical protein IKI78_01905 [Clostridia bacterium]|nr:hypothetical protein [Clostridia bacterium]